MSTSISLKKMIVACMLCLVCLLCFTACNNLKTFSDNPQSSDVVYGNGSLAVVKGDYVYYANGYVGYSDVGETNKDGEITYSALYRTKLVNGQVVENDKELDSDGNEIFDKTQGIKNTDILVSKVCGFEYMGLYIFDDYIYYATPNNQKSGDLSVCTDLIDFCRTKLDRSGSRELLYTTKNPGANVSYSMYQKDGVVYQIIQDGDSSTDSSKLVVYTYGSKKSNFITDANWTITGYAKTSYTRSDQVVCSGDKYVYFTYQTEDASDYTILAKLELGTKNITIVDNSSDTTYSLINSSNNNLYYTKNVAGNAGAYLYANDLSKNFSSGEKQLTYSPDYSKYIALTSDVGIGALVYDSTNTVIYKKVGNNDMTQVLSGTAVDTVITVYGNFFYFISSSTLYRIDFVNNGELETLISSDLKADNSNYISVAGNKLFYLKQYTGSDSTTSYYVHMINFDIIDEDTSTYYNHFVGVLQEKDYVSESE